MPCAEWGNLLSDSARDRSVPVASSYGGVNQAGTTLERSVLHGITSYANRDNSDCTTNRCIAGNSTLSPMRIPQ